ncbi:acyltransferase [Caulobacter sp. S45]|uniref:acyltransferase family protein n=1 Tax=Caulobacter sp. S45 TaxID=1641861 RepID=UPI00157656B4|nr:acyltransferase [Caulobacter sp. S45]
MFNNIQALRAVAAFLVVFVHLQAPLKALGLPSFGAEGVNLFFVISGFIMVATTSRRPVTGSAFMLNRVARIAPMYWLVTLAVALMAVFAPRLLGSTRVSGVELLKSLVFLPYRRGSGPMEPVLFVGWTLNYEMAFYILFAVTLWLRRPFTRFLATAEVLIVLVVLGLLIQGGDLWKFYTNQIVLDFAAGMMLGVLTPAIARQAARTPRPLMWGAGAVMFLFLVVNEQILPSELSRAAACLESTVLVACALGLEATGARARSPLVLALGDASYSIYLLHPFVTQTVILLARHELKPSIASAAGVVLVSLVAVALAGVAAHRWVETPLSRAARDLLRARRLGPDDKRLA